MFIDCFALQLPRILNFLSWNESWVGEGQEGSRCSQKGNFARIFSPKKKKSKINFNLHLRIWTAWSHRARALPRSTTGWIWMKYYNFWYLTVMLDLDETLKVQLLISDIQIGFGWNIESTTFDIWLSDWWRRRTSSRGRSTSWGRTKRTIKWLFLQLFGHQMPR